MATSVQQPLIVLEEVGVPGGGRRWSPAVDGESIIGRSRECSIRFDDALVSRHHASIGFRGGRWWLRDLASRHGTRLNGLRIEPDHAYPLSTGDRILVGGRTLRVTSAAGETDGGLYHSLHTLRMHTSNVGGSAERAVEGSGALDRKRLDLLLKISSELQNASDLEQLTRALLRSAVAGTGYEQAALLRPDRDMAEVEVIAAVPAPAPAPGGVPGTSETSGTGAARFEFSRSLLRVASSGTTAVLRRGPEMATPDSIERLDIRNAICAPVIVDECIEAYLYIDARGDSQHAAPDAAGFTEALARLAGLSLANFERREMARRQAVLERDLALARQAQMMLLPPESGFVNGVRYAMQMAPGRFVAGDLFNLVPLGENQVAVAIGDVTGEGAGSAMLMAVTQAQLDAALRDERDPAVVAREVNRYISAHSSSMMFVTLWLGIIDRREGRLVYCDAGHGHWVLHPRGRQPHLVPHDRSLILGVDPEAKYVSCALPLQPGDRVVLFTDGVVEQRERAGERSLFGIERAVESLAVAGSAEEDVAALFAAVRAFAGGEELSDDATVASIEVT